MTYYDPPSGWQYGFPKPYEPLPRETLHDTLIRDGYPPEMARLYHTYCRFYGSQEINEQNSSPTEAGTE